MVDAVSGFFVLASSVANFTLAISSDSLIYGGCAGYTFQSGSYSLTDGVGNVVKTTWDNCEGVVTYNGSPLEED